MTNQDKETPCLTPNRADDLVGAYLQRILEQLERIEHRVALIEQLMAKPVIALGPRKRKR